MVAVSAIAPIFLMILSGYFCKKYQFPDPGFWRGAEKITYFLLIPALLLSKIATAEIDSSHFLSPFLAIVLLYLIMTALLILIKVWRKTGNAQFTSIYQGSIRFNTYIGLAIISSLYQTEGLVAAIFLASMMIPVINISCVLILEYYGKDKGGNSLNRVIRSVISNPLIIACGVGLAINISAFPLPFVLTETMNILAKAALPLGLLTVGAALTISTIKTSLSPLILASLFKFLILPGIAMSLCTLFEITGITRQAFLVLTVLPTATASYVLAKQLGGDHQLMATLISAETLLALPLIPLMLLVFA